MEEDNGDHGLFEEIACDIDELEEDDDAEYLPTEEPEDDDDNDVLKIYRPSHYIFEESVAFTDQVVPSFSFNDVEGEHQHFTESQGFTNYKSVKCSSIADLFE